MSKLNLPPFYVGQKVVAIKDSQDGKAKRGIIYTVALCIQCKCGAWMVGIVELPAEYDSSYHNRCLNLYEHTGIYCRFGESKYFAPVQEEFQSISLEKVIEKEKPLTCAN